MPINGKRDPDLMPWKDVAREMKMSVKTTQDLFDLALTKMLAKMVERGIEDAHEALAYGLLAEHHACIHSDAAIVLESTATPASKLPTTIPHLVKGNNK